jgi:hypothetical protein
LKEKILKILLRVLYFGILNSEASVASGIDDDKIDSPKSEPYIQPKAPHFRQVSRRLRCQGARPLPRQAADILRQPLDDANKTPIPAAQSAIHSLLPHQVIDVLRQLNKNGTINESTLVVWDVDDTLLEEGSILRLSGPRLIHPDFPKFIRATQTKRTTHIALTNGGARYRTQLIQDDGGNWSVTNITPVDFSVADSDERGKKNSFIPFYLKSRFKDTDRVSGEFLRIAGLECIGISFGKAFKRSEFLKPRHVLGILEEQNHPFCAPVFASGVIFSNFMNSHIHHSGRHRKGDILRLFLDECKEKNNQVFSNVVFIDDTLPCVENVVKVMEEIDMPCIGINILSTE